MLPVHAAAAIIGVSAAALLTRYDAMTAPTKAGSSFPTTRWSIVVHAGDATTTQAQMALETLCRQYWYPLYAHARRHCRNKEQAEDATQAFFVHLLTTSAIAHARKDRGRFRTFLLSAFRNFLITQWKSERAAKRGGQVVFVPLDLTHGEHAFAREPSAGALTAEQAFDRAWALELVEQAIASLRTDYEDSGRGELFRVLRPIIWGAEYGKLHDCAARVGISEHAVRMALHRLRNRLAERLRQRVAETVADPDEVEGELRHLISVFTAS